MKLKEVIYGELEEFPVTKYENISLQNITLRAELSNESHCNHYYDDLLKPLG